MPRSRLLLTAPIVLAVVLIGVFAVRSRGGNHSNVNTSSSKNCPPVARADVAATKPGQAVAIDVLANDTDPDGDPLVFQILSTTGGESTNDDGGTPTDASDDRIQFTPADPPPAQATIRYQALDPQGAVGESTVTVYINADGTLPAGVQSDTVPADGKVDSSGKCAGSTTSTTSGDFASDTTTPSETTLTTTTSDTLQFTDLGGTNSGGHTTTTRPKATTTTRPQSTTTIHTTTTRGPEPTTTTQPHETTTTQPDPCGPYPVNGTQDQKNQWTACEEGRGHS